MLKSPMGKVAPTPLGHRLNTSTRAQCIPILLGRAQTAPRIIWKSNVQAHRNASKKGKASKKSGQTAQTYSANFDMLLATTGFGRVRQDVFTDQRLLNILACWTDKSKYDLTFASQTRVIASGQIVVAPPTGFFWQVIAISYPQSYSVPLNDYGGNGPVTLTGSYEQFLWNRYWFYYDETSQLPVDGDNRLPNYREQPGAPPSSTISIHGIADGQTVKVYYAYSPSGFSKVPLVQISALTYGGVNFEPQLGTSGLSDQPIHYDDVSGIFGSGVDLGMANMAPNFKFEALGWGGLNQNGDVNPIDALTTLLMCPHGLNLSGFLLQSGGAAPSTLFGDLTAARNYCIANNIFASFYLDQQQGDQVFTDILDIANLACFWSEGKYKLVPWSEVSVVGNGVTYTSPTAAGPDFRIFPQDLLSDPGKPPVVITREILKDVKNIIPIEFTDRANDYTIDAVQVTDYESVADFGARIDNTSSRQFHALMDPTSARAVGAALVRRGTIQQRTTLKFKLSPRFISIEPMSLIEITDPMSDLAAFPARIIKTNIVENSSIECEAIPFYYGSAAPAILDVQVGTPDPHFTNIDPGAAGTPEFIEPVPRLFGSGQPQLWIAVPSSSATYGGCQVWVSVDGGSSYLSLGRFPGTSVTGVIPGGSSQPAGNDPDTTNNFDVNLAESLGVLESWSAAAADNFVPLIYLSGGAGVIPYELEAYTTAMLVSGNRYTLKATGAGNEIRRSVFGAPTVGVGVLHAAGKRFVYLEGPLFKTALDPNWIGKALHFKFTAFNIFGLAEQALADVTDYPYTPTGVAAQLSSSGGYTISPAQPLSQAASTYVVAMAQTVATWLATGQQTNYNSRNFSVPDPGVGNTQQYWVTVFDPNIVGDTGSGTTLSSFCETNQTKWNTAGYIRIGTIVVTHTGTVSGGGGGSSPAGFRQLSILQSPDGLRTNFSLDSNVTSLVVFREGAKVNSVDITFTPGTSTFTLAFAPQTGEHLEAIGS